MAQCHAWQPWVPHVGPMSLLKLHGLTGAGVFVATGATGCGICRGWVTTSCWLHHLGNKWIYQTFAHLYLQPRVPRCALLKSKTSNKNTTRGNVSYSRKLNLKRGAETQHKYIYTHQYIYINKQNIKTHKSHSKG